MKTLITITLNVGLALSLLASSPPQEYSCIVAPILTHRLPAGVWTGENQHQEPVQILFHENGLAQRLPSNPASVEPLLYEWAAIPGPAGCASLQLTDLKQGTTITFTVNAACNTLNLSNSAHALQWTLTQEAGERPAQRQRTLQGTWGNTTYPFKANLQGQPDMKGAYLQYEFEPNGHFVRRLGNQQRQVEEQGRYILSPDSQHIILQFENGCTTVAALKYLQFDELVVQHILRCEDPVFSTGNKDFYFNRS